MNSKLILHLDENHPLLIKGLEELGFKNHIVHDSDVNLDHAIEIWIGAIHI